MPHQDTSLRKLHFSAAGKRYELLLAADTLALPEALEAKLGAPVEFLQPARAAAPRTRPAQLAELSLRASPLVEEEAEVQWLQCSEPILTLPDAAPTELEQQVINGTVGRFTERRIRERLHATIDLPPLAQTTKLLLALAVKQHAGAEDLVTVLEQDSSLAARIVGWANSPYYAAARGARSIRDAIVRVLGYDTSLALAMGITLGHQVPSAALGEASKRSFWVEALLTASLCERLHGHIPSTDYSAGEAYLAGLLSNFGTLVLAHTFPPQYERIQALTTANPDILYSHCDMAVLGMDREMIAAALLNSWELPATITQAIREQHLPSSKLPLALLLRCARALLAQEGLSVVPDQGRVGTIAARLRLSDDALEDTRLLLMQPAGELEALVSQFLR